MAQRALDDPVSVEYTTALTELWEDWEPAMRRTERSLVAWQHAPVLGPRFSEPTEVLQRTQYRAHVTAERALGLMPPLVAFEAHRYFVEVLGYCRDTLGALAVADELGEDLSDESIEAGLQALHTSREAFQAAQYASYAVMNHPDGFHPSRARATLPEPVIPRWVTGTVTIAGLVTLAASMFMLLLLGPGQA